MPSLILEGGTLRGIFSAGAMDALLDNDIMFPYCIGVSAGISNGVSYLSRQSRRNLEILEKYRLDHRYLSYRNFLRCRSIFGLDFVFGEIPDHLVPFDWNTYSQYTGTVLVGVTNATTGSSEYLDGHKMDKKFTMLRATCAIPMFFPTITIEGTPYYDGGLADPIPVKKAIIDGNQKHLILLTQPKGYQKKLNRETEFAARILKRKYPKLSEVMLTRHLHYNDTVKYCEKLEEDGSAIILRPHASLNSFEKDVDVIRRNYEEGYAAALQRLDDIAKLF